MESKAWWHYCEQVKMIGKRDKGKQSTKASVNKEAKNEVSTL